MAEIVAALIGGGLLLGGNALMLAFFLGDYKRRVLDHGERIEKLETKVDGLSIGFAAMKGASGE